MTHQLAAAAFAVLAINASVVCAVAPDESMFSFHGFGTLGVVHSSEHNADFVGDFFQPNGAGFTRSLSAGVDSKLGLQMDARLSEQFSATVQVASRLQYDNTYRPQIEWANVKYQFTPDLSVRVGRMVTSFFSASDSGLVSYTHPWVRPPLEVYGRLTIKHKDGVDALYRFHVGEVTNSLEASYGKFSAKLPSGGESRETHFFDITETLEYGAASFRFGYASLRIEVDNPGLDDLFGGFTQFGNALSVIPGLEPVGAQALSLVERYQVNDVPYSLLTLGANYDPGAWLLMAEWVRVQGSGPIPSSTAGYVTGGYRIAAFTPYLTLATVKSKERSEPGIQTTGLPPELAATAAGLNGGLAATLKEFAQSQKTVSAGVRWDFMRSAALKLQYERLSALGNSAGLLTNVQPGFQPGSAIHVVSATVDFVF